MVNNDDEVDWRDERSLADDWSDADGERDAKFFLSIGSHFSVALNCPFNSRPFSIESILAIDSLRAFRLASNFSIEIRRFRDCTFCPKCNNSAVHVTTTTTITMRLTARILANGWTVCGAKRRNRKNITTVMIIIMSPFPAWFRYWLPATVRIRNASLNERRLKNK